MALAKCCTYLYIVIRSIHLDTPRAPLTTLYLKLSIDNSPLNITSNCTNDINKAIVMDTRDCYRAVIWL